MTQAKRGTIVVLGTGGTIAGVGGDVGYRAGAVGIDRLLDTAQECRATIETEQVLQIDSKDLTFADWRRLVDAVARHLARDEVTGLVITHGTDTLEETACLLQRIFAPARPVVLVGAMRPADSAQSDGPQNLRDALALASKPGARGVLVAFAGAVFDPLEVRKVQPYRLAAFGSGEACPLAVIEDGRVRRFRDWPAGIALGSDVLPVDPADWPIVEIVASHAGARGATVDALVASGAVGLVVAATGNGTVHAALEPALSRAVAAGVVVRRATRWLHGAIVEGAVDKTGDESPLPSAGAATPVRARIELMLELMARRRSG